MTRKFELQGSIVPLVTPLTEKEELDAPAISRLLSFHQQQGTDALFLLGTCGEGPCLHDAVKLRLIEEVLGEAGTVPVLAGVTDTATYRAVLLAQKWADLGVSAIVVMPPIFQFATGIQEHLCHIRAIADAVDVPVILYNLPKKTGNQAIPLQAIRVLATDPRILGIKESSGDLDYLASLLKIRDEFPSFRIMNGEIKTARQALEMGADGLVMSYTNVDPAGCTELIAAVRSGNRTKAAVIQEKMIAVWTAFPEYASPAAKAKSILAAKGYCQPRCCVPATSLGAELPEPLRS